MEFSNGFLLSLSLCLDIGLANIAMITLSMQRGFSKGLWLGLGTCVGDLAYAILAMLGMAVLLQYEAVRYVLWLGGTAVLAWFCFRMVMSATTVSAGLENQDVHSEKSSLALFLRGIFLAMSSPSAILWFAAVGGALIARQGSDLASASTFLAGFVAAGGGLVDLAVRAGTPGRAFHGRADAALVLHCLCAHLCLFHVVCGDHGVSGVCRCSTGGACVLACRPVSALPGCRRPADFSRPIRSYRSTSKDDPCNLAPIGHNTRLRFRS